MLVYHTDAIDFIGNWILRKTLYRCFFVAISPYLPNTGFGQFVKWKLALLLVGDEFHQQNLLNNRDKLAPHFAHDTPLQANLAELLPFDATTDVKVLDIGAGPVSKVGKIHNGHEVELVPIDPMADKYRKILSALNLQPKYWTRYGEGERLSQQFEENSFDLIHARNSIDHCLNPITVIEEAIKVLKPKCYFYLNHYRNEGKAAKYYGLHQWNFDVVNEDFIISNRFGEQINVNNTLRHKALIHQIKQTEERLIVIIQKR
ncbi:methyltransferase domain-containing protein [Shewanella frigidimarina]|nr:methyltransferase domain-containing protein [Shewanella frigidimarina]